MQRSKVDFFMSANNSRFPAAALPSIRERLEQMDDRQFMAVHSTSFQDPTVIIVIAIFLGWERFFLDDIGLGILKVITCQGFGIWWLVDIITAMDRAKQYNYNKFTQITGCYSPNYY